MIKISIMYSNTGKFDMDYYLDIHMPKSIVRLRAGQGYRGVSVERGPGGVAPGSAPSYVALCHYLFDTAEDFMAAYLPHVTELQSFKPNYTDIESIIQFSEIAISF